MQSRRRILFLGVMAALAFVFLGAAHAQSAPQHGVAKSAAASSPKSNLSGIWQLQGTGAQESFAPESAMPPMTPWAQARFDAARPGYGSRATPASNDPILQCDPMGFPRIMFMPTPFEFVQAPGRVLQFWEREHEWRSIWTDGRSLPEDPDPAWYGYAVGHWEEDGTLVVESAGFTDKTWLTVAGYPHSDALRITERYRRQNHDTLLYNITVTDPKAYAKPIVGPQRTVKLKQGAEIEELPCVWSQENEFARRIREPAGAKPAQ